MIAQRRVRASFMLATALALMCGAALADDAPDELFARGVAALDKGEYSVAIDDFEALADRGFVHPDASYDRGLAYLARVRAKADRPGDLGRAAAAFEEALLLRPNDHDADAALDAVRAEVTRRRSHRAKDTIEVRPTLDRMLVGLAGAETWAVLATIASIATAIGIVLRSRASRRAHIAGSIVAPIAFLALVAFVPLAWGARYLAASTRPAVVVVSEAYLSDGDGRSIQGEPLPEAASVEVGERRGALVHVRWGATEGWVPASSVRLLATGNDEAP